MLRTHTCGELNMAHVGLNVTLCGWLQRSRDMGGLTFIDLRDRYGITQLVFNLEVNRDLCLEARKLGREFVISVTGKVAERSNKNLKIATGNIEILVEQFTILNTSLVPPFTIEDTTDGGEELRMKYRYLDLRRSPNRTNLELRHEMAIEIRNYLNGLQFLEIETPYMIKSTPEGARDFVVPSRMNQGQFYALPQSPQQFKQLLMVAGYDRYFQIVRCFRDEDLRADRQPEFTQIDCEMSFVTQEDILSTFEGLARHLFRSVLNLEVQEFPRLTYDQAMKLYGSDKPDIRFGMTFTEITDLVKGNNFKVFDEAELVEAVVPVLVKLGPGAVYRHLERFWRFEVRVPGYFDVVEPTVDCARSASAGTEIVVGAAEDSVTALRATNCGDFSRLLANYWHKASSRALRRNRRSAASRRRASRCRWRTSFRSRAFSS